MREPYSGKRAAFLIELEKCRKKLKTNLIVLDPVKEYEYLKSLNNNKSKELIIKEYKKTK